MLFIFNSLTPPKALITFLFHVVNIKITITGLQKTERFPLVTDHF